MCRLATKPTTTTTYNSYEFTDIFIIYVTHDGKEKHKHFTKLFCVYLKTNYNSTSEIHQQRNIYRNRAYSVEYALNVHTKKTKPHNIVQTKQNKSMCIYNC